MCQKTTKHKILTFAAWIAAHITLVVVLVTIVALFFPSSFAWMSTSSITPMLGVVMFGMGLTLTPSDFNPVLQHPKDILVGGEIIAAKRIPAVFLSMIAPFS